MDKKTVAFHVRKKEKKRRKALEKYYANSRLDPLEQRRRVEWDMVRGNKVPKD